WTAMLPALRLPVTAPAIVGSVLVLNAVALIFTIPIFNYFGIIAANMRGQLAACAAGLATYYLVARRFNPAAWALLAGTLGIAMVVSTAFAPSRRMLLGVLLAVPWAYYFAVWRYRSAGSNFARVGLFCAAAVLAI